MTEPREKPTKARRRSALPLSLFGIVSLSLLFLFLYDSQQSLTLVNEGLLLCFSRVVPALFPFMVLSSMIVSSGILSPLSRLLAPLCRRLFGVGGESGCVWILGLLCGFPVAASSGVELYRSGRIGSRELRRLLLFANNPSLSFLLGGVGAALYGDVRIGILFCLVTLLSSLILGVGIRFFTGSAEGDPPEALAPREEPLSVPLLFCRSVTSSVSALLSVLGFVVFFYTLTGVLSHVVGGADTVSPSSALLLGFFEMTGGMARAALCEPPLSYLLAAFLAGFSGLSVHCQIASICAPARVSLAPYLLAKTAQGVLNLLLMGVLLRFCGFLG